MSAISTTHLRYIDCLRGYAVLMVISSHLAYAYPQLPYPAHRLVVSGWFGVQLFFLVSCVTLLMSWTREAARYGRCDRVAFLLRRLFRIAPAYYLAAVVYFLATPPPGGFEPGHALATVLFVNAWQPEWAPTVPGAWAVVPGGWSISVEFGFYLLFPLLAPLMRSLPRALAGLGIAIAIGLAANLGMAQALRGSYGEPAIAGFLFFWLPNEISVFALGAVVFFLLPWARRQSASMAAIGALASLALFAALAYAPLGAYIGARPFAPQSLTASLPLAGLVLSLAAARAPFTNRYVAAMGQVSFSAYLLHFLVLRAMEEFPALLRLNVSGPAAIAAYVAGWAVAVLLTFLLAALSFRCIEQPGIRLGAHLLRRRHAPSEALGPAG